MSRHIIYIYTEYVYVYIIYAQQTPGLSPESQDLPEVSPVIC